MSDPRICYMDYNATTPVAPEVLEAMLPFLTTRWGNPSSAYSFGNETGRDLAEARAAVARLINAQPKELIFTSCGTESINSAFHSALVSQSGKKHIVTTAVEHSATMKYCAYLGRQGYSVTLLPVSSEGALDLASLEAAIRPDTALVSVMWANNETGIIFPIKEIAAICHAKGTLFHSDAVQAAGKLALDVVDSQVDLLSLSAHKLCAPKGVGALYVSRRIKYQPYIIGGGQERGRRGGTENVAGIVAFGRAARLAHEVAGRERARLRTLRDKLESGILNGVPGVARNGAAEPRLPNTTNLAFDGVEAEGVLLLLDQAGICASSGSACTTGSLEPSHVLTALGCDVARARSSLRFSLGMYSTEEDVDGVLDVLPGIISKLREHAPVQPR